MHFSLVILKYQHYLYCLYNKEYSLKNIGHYHIFLILIVNFQNYYFKMLTIKINLLLDYYLNFIKFALECLMPFDDFLINF